ncbi:MAG: AMP-binding protein [Candidatus Puniceispirillaceae bacterium]
MAQRITLGELLHDIADRYEDRPAVTDVITGKTLSYRALENYTNRIAHGLKSLPEINIGYVGIMHENALSYLALTYALKKLDLIEVSINRAFKGASLARMINLTQCQILMTSGAHFDALHDIIEELPHLTTLLVTDGLQEAQERFSSLSVILFDSLLSDEDSHITARNKDTDVATIMFTSGTTGVSKGCLLSHRYAVRTAENMIGPFRLTKDDVNYTPYPLSHIGPAYYDILPTFMTGGHVIMRDKFSLSKFWDEAIEYGVTWFMCLGSVQQLLYAAPQSDKDKAHKITRMWSTPAPVPKKDFDERFGLHLIPGGGYGSTDAGWVVVPQWDHEGGIVLPHFEVAVVDDNDDLLPPFTKGEIVIRPKEPGVMSDGYFGMADKTNESRRNLWFHTGDIGWLDEDGLFYFTCRKFERIRIKGELVSAFEIEEGVLTHPAIEDAAAIGIEADYGEEQIRLFVIIKTGMRLSEEEIISHCSQVMAKFMVPSIVTILDSFPRTPTGKTEKGVLKSYPV